MPAASSSGFVPLIELHRAFAGPTLHARGAAARRWARVCRDRGQACKSGGGWQIAPQAHLPDGLTVESYLKVGPRPQTAGPPPPPSSARWAQKDWERFFNSHELLKLWEAFQQSSTVNRQSSIVNGQSSIFAAFMLRHAADIARLGFKHLSPRTLRRIRHRLDPNSGPDFDGNVRPRRSGIGFQPVSPDAWEFFKSLWLTPQRRKVSICWELTKIEADKAGWPWPALRTIQQRVTHQLPPFFSDYYRLGPQAWARLHAPRIERDLSAVRPNQCWIGDHARFDFLARHNHKPVRPWLTAWEDQRSRMIVGWQITAQPDSDTILAAFGAPALERGVPEQVIIDNGKDYRAKGLSGGRRGKPRLDEDYVRSVFGRLDIHVTFCEPFNPGSKAIESFFNGLHERFDKLFDSYCGRDPQHRPAELYKRLRAHELELPTLDEVRTRFAAWLEAYHRRPHSGDGLEGLCPLDAFERFEPIAKRTAPQRVLERLLCKTVKVTVTRKGVCYDNIHYGQANTKLLALHGREVLLRLDPGQADQIEVCDLDGRHLTWALHQRIRGLTRDDIKRAKKRQKRARQLAKSAAPALRDARKSVVEHALAAQAEYAQQLRQAAGAEHCGPAVSAVARPLALIAAAADVVLTPAAVPIDESPEIPALDWDEAELADDAELALDFGDQGEQARTPAALDLLEFGDG
jgi:transposase InsO family protein